MGLKKATSYKEGHSSKSLSGVVRLILDGIFYFTCLKIKETGEKNACVQALMETRCLNCSYKCELHLAEDDGSRWCSHDEWLRGPWGRRLPTLDGDQSCT